MTGLITMAQVSVMVVNAFTYQGGGGNPAGVVLDADQYSQEQKQEIARLAGFPETAFVSRSGVADRKLEFFTPNKQIAHCGHATVATFSYLNQMGEIETGNSSKETIDGIRKITLEDGKAFMEQKPQFIKMLDEEQILDVLTSLSLDDNDLMEGYKPVISNTGVGFIIIPLKDRGALEKINTDFDVVADISEEHDLIGFYAFSDDPIDADHDVTTRMFAPRYAIPEEPATGMAAGNLGYYLHSRMNYPSDRIVVEQGYFMEKQSKSEIIVKLNKKDGILENIMAGGSAKTQKTIQIHLSD